MNTSPTAVRWRTFGKPLLVAAMVSWLLLSALASASPSVHHWLHHDHQAPSHFCLVTMLEHGHSDVTSVWVAIPMQAAQIAVATLPCESFFISHDLTLHPERGPPLLS